MMALGIKFMPNLNGYHVPSPSIYKICLTVLLGIFAL